MPVLESDYQKKKEYWANTVMEIETKEVKDYSFCWENKLYIINSLFKKNNKTMWTWLSPKKRKSEIDYILTNRKQNLSNFEIISNLTFPSDHSLLRSTLQITQIKKTRANFKDYITKLTTLEEREQFIQTLSTNMYEIKLDGNENIQSLYKKLTTTIISSLNSIEQKPKKRETIPGYIKCFRIRRNE